VARVIVGGRPSSYGGRPLPLPEAGSSGVPMPMPVQSRGAAQQQFYDGMAEADVNLLSPTELFFLARRPGSMNVVLQGTDGRCISKDLLVTIDPSVLQAKLVELLPEETGIKVHGADHSMVLTGTVTDALKLDQVMSVAGAFGEGRRVVNLLRVTAPQQVMLEVKIAEVSKTLLDRFGLDFTRIVSSGTHTSIISGILGGAPGVLGRFGPNVAGGTITGSAAGSVSSELGAAGAGVTTGSRGATLLGADLQKRDGIFRVLAEPNIMAISGQAASFLSGGKIFIPVAQTQAGGFATITLEEKEFGVGLKFTPTVLDGRINLKVISEVSELSQTGTPFTSVGGVTAILPSLSTRRVDTTVQLGDGQSFAVAGLIRNNMTEALNKLPGLGEVPVVGALFRSSEFQNDQTELLFIVTPRLVKPLAVPVALPTDNHVPPTRADVILMGSGEGRDRAPAPAPGTPGTPPAAPLPAAAPAVPSATRP
jgi:pilus assembly protein CpaC